MLRFSQLFRKATPVEVSSLSGGAKFERLSNTLHIAFASSTSLTAQHLHLTSLSIVGAALGNYDYST